MARTSRFSQEVRERAVRMHVELAAVCVLALHRRHREAHEHPSDQQSLVALLLPRVRI
jgi:hypothetical protein